MRIQLKIDSALAATCASTAILGSLLFAIGPARAQVVVEPDGPASKQYSAVLDRERERGSGGDGTAGVPGSDAEAPLFGEGISPAGGSRPGGGPTGGGEASGGDDPTALSPPAPSLSSAGGEDSTVEIALICIAVLAGSALIAFTLRQGLGRRAG